MKERKTVVDIRILGGYQKNKNTGVGKYVHDLADMLNASGFTTEVIYEKFSDNFVKRFFERFLFLPLRIRKSSRSVMLTILPDESYSFLLPSIASIQKSIIVHDVRPLSLAGGGYSLLREYFLKIQNSIFLNLADVIIVPSQFTRMSLGRGIVIPNVFELSQKRFDAHLPAELKNKNYLLYVGTNQYRKNFVTADKVSKLAKEKYNLEFVCVGNLQPSQGVAYSKVNDMQLSALYQNAFALVNPSLFEGFGRVVVEAQKNGCPVISTSCSALGEVLGESALLVANPTDSTDYLDCIHSLFDFKYRSSLIDKGYENSKRFEKHYLVVKSLIDCTVLKRY